MSALCFVVLSFFVLFSGHSFTRLPVQVRSSCLLITVAAWRREMCVAGREPILELPQHARLPRPLELQAASVLDSEAWSADAA